VPRKRDKAWKENHRNAACELGENIRSGGRYEQQVRTLRDSDMLDALSRLASPASLKRSVMTF